MIDLSNFEITTSTIVIVVSIIIFGFIVVFISSYKSCHPSKFKNGWVNFFIGLGEFALFCLTCFIFYQMLTPNVTYSSSIKEIPILSVDDTDKNQVIIEEQINGNIRKAIYPKTELILVVSDDENYHFSEEKPVRIKTYKLFGFNIETTKENMDERLNLAIPKNKETEE